MVMKGSSAYIKICDSSFTTLQLFPVIFGLYKKKCGADCFE